MRVYIAEKKSLGIKVATALGGGTPTNGYIKGTDWAVYFCRGHILEMLQPQEYNPEWKKWSAEALPMIPPTWKIKPKEGVEHLLSLIETGLKTASVVINVGDSDREGQLLVDEVLDFYGWSGTTKRLWFNDQSQEYITKNIDDLKDNAQYKALSHQALARGRADWMIGLNASRAYTVSARKNGVDELISVGRVQTPTLALIVNRDIEIENFISKPYYEIEGVFGAGEEQYTGKLMAIEDDKPCIKSITEKKEAQYIAEQEVKTAVIMDKTTKPVKQKQPLCFSKSDLVEACFKSLGFDGDKVLSIAQNLYDKHEAVTYPRTDCGYLPEAKHAQATEIINRLSGVEGLQSIATNATPSIKSHTWNDKKLTAHDGIIPTESFTADKFGKMSGDEQAVFLIIATRYLAQFYEEQATEVTEFITRVNDEYDFTTKGVVLINKGWSILYPEKEKKDKDIPALDNGMTITPAELLLITKKTSPPKPFNDGNIENAMKNIARYIDDEDAKNILKDNEGIGEESTRSNIIKLLKTRAYIETKGKNLVSTTKGRAIIKAVKGDIKSAVKTAIMERELKLISDDISQVDAYIATQISYAERIVNDATSADFSDFESTEHGEQCPTCNKGRLSVRKSEYGKFWGCSGWKEGCKATFKDLGGKPYLKDFYCTCKKGRLELINGKNGAFFGCDSRDCSNTFSVVRNKPEFKKKKR